MTGTDPAETARWMVLAAPPIPGFDDLAGIGPVASEASARKLQADLRKAGWEPSEPLRYFSAAEARALIAAARPPGRNRAGGVQRGEGDPRA